MAETKINHYKTDEERLQHVVQIRVNSKHLQFIERLVAVDKANVERSNMGRVICSCIDFAIQKTEENEANVK